ncbi:hypothetical protein MYX82_07580 [Acidobacteria bacterium AH-259-D05]|nr:hypothetical protein [Acidobacteria bacterium AH-259-D05]
MKRLWIASFLLPCAVAWAISQSPQQDSIVLITGVSRTAIYVGDVFEYRISVRHPDQFSFVTEELEDKLVVRPFELLDFQFEQKDLGEETLLEMVLRLVCYQKPGVLEIPSFDLFYYPSGALSREGTATRQDVPARALRVPAHRIHLQSTLLGEGDQLRDSIVVMSFPRGDLVLPTLAAVVLLLLLAGLALVGVRYLIQLRQLEGEDHRVRLQEEALQSIRHVRQRSSQQPETALYLEISQVIRRYLGSRYGFFSSALTPEEVRDELKTSTSNGEFAAQVENLLDLCDRVFFGGVTAPLPDLPDLCAQAENVVKSTPLET